MTSLVFDLAVKSASTNEVAARQRCHLIQNGGLRMTAIAGLIRWS
ncbi:hypothetical protein [Bradyrhizobium sp. NAS96.2]|nr:hypothetical protein [Bradyrhizobium sp. NAS96.2]